MTGLITEPVARMLVHPSSNKVLSVISTDSFPHSIVLASIILDGDKIYVGEAYMHRTVEYLTACPNAEILVWMGKDGYSLKVRATARLTEGHILEKMDELLGKRNMHAVAVWEFEPYSVWDESASYSSGDRVA